MSNKVISALENLWKFIHDPASSAAKQRAVQAVKTAAAEFQAAEPAVVAVADMTGHPGLALIAAQVDALAKGVQAVTDSNLSLAGKVEAVGTNLQTMAAGHAETQAKIDGVVKTVEAVANALQPVTPIPDNLP